MYQKYFRFLKTLTLTFCPCIYLKIHCDPIIIIIIIHSWELLTSALADGFSLESEWQQVSSSL